jgi:hypothetical protein
MLIVWEEYNYFINCTAVQLMIFPKQTKWRKGILNTNENTRQTKAPNFALINKRTKWKYEQKHQILLKVWQDWALAR